MSGWVMRVLARQLEGAQHGGPIELTYAANIQDVGEAWAAVAKVAARDDPMAMPEIIGPASDAQLRGHGVADGEVKEIGGGPIECE